MKQRLRPEVRHDQILTAARKVACRVGYKNITREAVAEKAGCATGLITHYFTTMIQLRRAVIRAAVANDDVAIIAQGIEERSKYVAKAKPAALREARKLLAAA